MSDLRTMTPEQLCEELLDESHGYETSDTRRERGQHARNIADVTAEIVRRTSPHAGADDVRNAALEEAAEEVASYPFEHWESNDGRTDRITTAIRALKSPPHPAGTPEADVLAQMGRQDVPEMDAPGGTRPEADAEDDTRRKAINSLTDLIRVSGGSVSPQGYRLVETVVDSILARRPARPSDAEIERAFYRWADPPNTTASSLPSDVDMEALKIAFAAGLEAAARPEGKPEYDRPMGAHTNVDIWPDATDPPPVTGDVEGLQRYIHRAYHMMETVAPNEGEWCRYKDVARILSARVPGPDAATVEAAEAICGNWYDRFGCTEEGLSVKALDAIQKLAAYVLSSRPSA